MSLAPNETIEGYTRKNILLKAQDTRELTTEELLELRELTKIAVSHLLIKEPRNG